MEILIQNKKIKLLFLIVFTLLFYVSDKSVISAPIISTPLCGGPFPYVDMPPPMHTLQFHCSTNISGISPGMTYKLGVFTPSYKTIKESGHGNNIDFTTPDPIRYRFRASGPYQLGNTENITTKTLGNLVTLLNNNINANGTYIFDLLYDTYEADLGETTYYQPFTIGLYLDGGLPINSVSSNLNFSISNWFHVYTYTSPALRISGGPGFFKRNAYYQSEENNIEIASNNQWILQVSLSDDLNSGKDIVSMLDFSFKCGGLGFINLAPTFIKFANANQYYDAAQSLPGNFSTGTYDGKSLVKKQVLFIYGFKNSKVYKPGKYNSTVNYKINNATE